MLSRDIRHLLVADDKGEVVGMLSIKDVVKVLLAGQSEVVQKIISSALGSRAFFDDA
eukprot:gene7686-9846_t